LTTGAGDRSDPGGHTDPVEPTILDAEHGHRYEARIDGELAGFIDYRVHGRRIALIHTEVLPAHQGKGIGQRLASFALEDARRRDLRVVASCPYVRSYVERHPETQDIVVGMTPA
jgi:predicted GNAT family acetyltransferase